MTPGYKASAHVQITRECPDYPLSCICQWAKQHTNLCKNFVIVLTFYRSNSIQLIIYARIKYTYSYVLTCLRSFDNGLNSIQIVIYARITEHTCSNCINLFSFI